MIIKKFQGKTEAEAEALAKKELGENFTIIHVKNIKPTGILRIFKRTLVEMTVAKEEELELAQSKPGAESKGEVSVEKKDDTALQSKPIALMKDVTDKSEKGVEEKLESIQNLLEEKLKKQEEAPKENVKMQEEKNTQSDELLGFVKLLYNTMLDNEVSERYANQMIDEIEQNFNKDVQIEYVLSHIYQKMILKFGKPEGITPAAKGPKIIYFIGPTGVGKTTTLAKIASQFRLAENKNIALFTTDTYRISATDQLKTYANILGVPFQVIYSIDEILSNFELYKEYDYILVDTAGHSHHNAEQKQTMNEFIHAFDEKAETEVYLVLSTTTKYRDLISIADSYSELTKYKLIFTKLDETTTYGNLLNLRLHTMAPMSYVTCGQNVPDDIDMFHPQETVKKLLGGK